MVTNCNKPPDDLGAPRAFAPPRRAVTSFEVLVAFSLIVTVISLSVPLVVRHGRLLATARHYRIAVEELANQLERIASLPPAEVDAAVSSIEVSEFTAKGLSGAELSADVHDAEFGRRVTLHLSWDEPQRRETPLSMTAWVAAVEPKNASSAEEQP